jgi:hypothetical protein
MIGVDGFNVFTIETPNEARPRLGKLGGRPSKLRRFASPLVEKTPAVFESNPPLGFGHARGPLVVQASPGFEIAGRYPIGGQRCALDYLCIRSTPLTLIYLGV